MSEHRCSKCGIAIRNERGAIEVDGKIYGVECASQLDKFKSIESIDEIRPPFQAVMNELEESGLDKKYMDISRELRKKYPGKFYNPKDENDRRKMDPVDAKKCEQITAQRNLVKMKYDNSFYSFTDWATPVTDFETHPFIFSGNYNPKLPVSKPLASYLDPKRQAFTKDKLQYLSDTELKIRATQVFSQFFSPMNGSNTTWDMVTTHLPFIVAAQQPKEGDRISLIVGSRSDKRIDGRYVQIDIKENYNFGSLGMLRQVGTIHLVETVDGRPKKVSFGGHELYAPTSTRRIAGADMEILKTAKDNVEELQDYTTPEDRWLNQVMYEWTHVQKFEDMKTISKEINFLIDDIRAKGVDI